MGKKQCHFPEELIGNNIHVILEGKSKNSAFPPRPAWLTLRLQRA